MKKALVVDDSSTMRDILHDVLQEIGLAVSEAKDGVEGWETLRSGAPFAVALVDWNMPRMTGCELLQKIREDHQFDDMSVVIVTTETEMSKVQTVLQYGANGYIVKPFKVDAVVDQLRALGV